MDTIRTITDIDTVPHPKETTTGTFTGVIGTRSLVYNGADNITQILNKYTRPWLWFPTAGILVRLGQYGNQGVGTAEDLTSNVSEVGQIVDAKLVYVDLTNIGGGAATVNGQNLDGAYPLNMAATDQSPSSTPRLLDPFLVDGTSSPVRAVERL